MADAHLHFFSYNYFRMLTAQRGLSATPGNIAGTLGVLGWELPDESPRVFAARWVEELDRHGVAQAALLASLPGDEGSVAEAIEAYPDRFFGYFFLNPMTDNADGVIRKALDSGLRGLCLLPAMHRFSLREARVEAAVRIASETPGSVVFVHCGLLAVGVRGKLGLASPFDMSYSNPIDLHALALRFPQLPFVVPHFGAGYLRESLILASLCPNVYFDTSSHNTWVRFLEPDLTLTDVFRKALDVAGPQRLLFGTNSTGFPAGWDRSVLDEQLAVFDALGLNTEDRASILGGNLRRLLGNVPTGASAGARPIS
ncbi:MAG: amidohydrolase family protein [Bryobacterales bacterium]|nr:amidohydrolase family protein [Bryobacterales bacterium]